MNAEILPKYPDFSKEILSFIGHIRKSVSIAVVLVVLITIMGFILKNYNLNTLKIGLAGVGHLGKIHLKCLLKTKFQISGFYDPDINTRVEVEKNFGIRSFETIDDLILSSDCVDIVSPTSFHYDIAKKAIVSNKHVFIEKPLTESLEQASDLVQLAKKYDVKVQVGHVERYNPAIRSLKGIELNQDL